MSTPTMGDLEREIEDLKARAEEWDERMGLADDAEPDPYEDYRPYEIPTPGLIDIGDGIRRRRISGEMAANIANYRELVVYKDAKENYWLTSAASDAGVDEEHYTVFRGPEDLRILADRIEGAE